MSSYSDKRVLIIDDMPDMRSSLRSQVASLGIDKVGMASNVREALQQLREHKYDILLCDFFLGTGTDGQQFLDYVRTKNLIGRATLFIMITAETGYESVVTAAECLPDDYLLKPFTAESLKSRFEKLLEKKIRLAKVDKLQDQGRWADVVTACDEIIAAKDKYLVDAMRIKGNALIMAAQFTEAIKFYQQVIDLRPMPWASLGLARALNNNGESDRSKMLLTDLIGENPKLLAAYDLLGRIHTEAGQGEEALRVLDNACKVSPNSIARHRSIAGIAEHSNDHARVEKAMSIVVNKTRNTPLRDSNDYAKLVSAVTELGDTSKAITLINEAKTTFKESADVALLSAVESVTQQKAGNPAAAAEALQRAMENSAGTLPEATALAMAKAYLVNDKPDEATAILKNIIKNDPDSGVVHARISNLMKDHGGSEMAKALIETCAKEMIKLNNDAVEKARAGEYATAARMLHEAADKLPGNLQIVANASFSLLVDVFMNGMDAVKIREALQLQQNVQKKDAAHPKLAEISSLLAKIQQKYKLGTGG